MRRRTFNDRISEQYTRNRVGLPHPFRIMTVDEYPTLIGCLCIMKDTQQNFQNILNLENLCFVVGNVFEDGWMTKRLLIQKVFSNGGIERFEVSQKQIVVLNRRILMEDWFINNLEKRFNKSVKQRTLPSLLKEYIGMTDYQITLNKFPTLLLTDVYDYTIKNLAYTKVNITTKRSSILIEDTSPYNRGKVDKFSIYNATPDYSNINVFLFKT